MDFSLKTSAVPGGTAAAVQLLQGIAAAGGLAAYLNACLAIVLAVESAEAKAEGMAWLTSLQLDEVSLPALTEAIVQVCGNNATPGPCIMKALPLMELGFMWRPAYRSELLGS